MSSSCQLKSLVSLHKSYDAATMSPPLPSPPSGRLCLTTQTRIIVGVDFRERCQLPRLRGQSDRDRPLRASGESFPSLGRPGVAAEGRGCRRRDHATGDTQGRARGSQGRAAALAGDAGGGRRGTVVGAAGGAVSVDGGEVRAADRQPHEVQAWVSGGAREAKEIERVGVELIDVGVSFRLMPLAGVCRWPPLSLLLSF